MNKKIIIVALLIIAMLAGCGTTKTETIDHSASSVQSTEESQAKTSKVTPEPEEPQVKTSEVIPDPEEMFPDAHVSILLYNKPTTYYQIKEYTDGDYEAYVDACIEAGFDDIQFKGGTDGNEMFLAYDQNHEFYLDVGISPDYGIINITCSVVDKEGE